MAASIAQLSTAEYARLQPTVLHHPGDNPLTLGADYADWKDFVAHAPGGLYLAEGVNHAKMPGYSEAAATLLSQTGELYEGGASAGQWTDALWYAEGMFNFIAEELGKVHPGAKLVVYPVMQQAPKFGIDSTSGDPRVRFMAHAVAPSENGNEVSVSLTNMMNYLNQNVIRMPRILDVDAKKGGWEINLHELMRYVEGHTDLLSYTTQMNGPDAKAGPNPFDVQHGLILRSQERASKEGGLHLPYFAFRVHREDMQEIMGTLSQGLTESENPVIRDLRRSPRPLVRYLSTGTTFSREDEDRLIVLSGPAFLEMEPLLATLLKRQLMDPVDGERFPDVIERLNGPEFYPDFGGQVMGHLGQFVDAALFSIQNLSNSRRGPAESLEVPVPVVVPFVMPARDDYTAGVRELVGVVQNEYFPQRLKEWGKGNLDINALLTGANTGVLPITAEGHVLEEGDEERLSSGLVGYMTDSMVRILGKEGLARLQQMGLVEPIAPEHAQKIDALLRAHFVGAPVETSFDAVLASKPITRAEFAAQRGETATFPGGEAGDAGNHVADTTAVAHLDRFRKPRAGARFENGFTSEGLHDGSAWGRATG